MTSNQKSVIELIRRISGQANVLTIPRLFIDITGDLKAALFLNQCIYWSDKTSRADGYFYKTYNEWEDETTLSRKELDKARVCCAKWVKTKITNANGAPTVHYFVDFDALFDTLMNCTKGANRIVQKGQIELSQTDKSITEITTNIKTPDVDTSGEPPAEDQPTGGISLDDLFPENPPAAPAPVKVDQHDKHRIARALAWVTGISFEKNKSRLYGESKHYSIDDLAALERDFAPRDDDHPDGGVWYRADWRGKQGKPPTLSQIREAWGTLVEPGRAAAQQHDEARGGRERTEKVEPAIRRVGKGWE